MHMNTAILPINMKRSEALSMFNMLQLYTKYANKTKSKPNLKSSHFYSLHSQKNTNFFTKMYLKKYNRNEIQKDPFPPIHCIFKIRG